MSETVMNLNTLPETLFNMFQTETIKFREEKGVVTIIPIKKGSGSPLFGMFKNLGNGHVVEDFSARKQREKELEI